MTAVSSGERPKAQAIPVAELDPIGLECGPREREHAGVVVELGRPGGVEPGRLGSPRELDVLALRGQLEQQAESHRAYLPSPTASASRSTCAGSLEAGMKISSSQPTSSNACA